MRSWCGWRLRAVVATYSSLFVTFALLLTLSYNDNRVIDNLGLDCLSERCWNKWYFCCCPVVASCVCDRGDTDFIGSGHGLGRRCLWVKMRDEMSRIQHDALTVGTVGAITSVLW